ncbi:NAD(P)H-quinone oxidoreductase [Croceibacterium ferulae]|uniref:NAD(P)H-quinone oxidoreductase n=1 Tax=Croceibacterium ferulae TaxID=1854641 RepID=UPI000EB109BC|nr:NAD(P)H-quinone oxidoreductase [Croceibacterium ferulae]
MDSQLPENMTAITIDPDAGGGPEALVPATVPVPAPGAGQVLIRVAHAGVNRPDVLQRRGLYPPPPGASEIPGLEVAGTIVALGEGADPALHGQTVCALLSGGGYAEYALADAGLCLPVPAGLSLAEAAALPETLFTVWHNVFQRGAAQAGQRLLVHGGTSGIGTMATMLGTLKGLEVFVTCGTDDKCAEALEIGADHAINYRTADFVERVMTLTDGEGVDLVLDMVAGSYTQRNLDCLAPDGRLVTIATLGGAKAEVNMAGVMMKRHTLTGSTLRARPAAFKAALAADLLQHAWPLVMDGALRPVMDESFQLADAAEAHRRMEAGDHVGKIVLDVAAG